MKSVHSHCKQSGEYISTDTEIQRQTDSDIDIYCTEIDGYRDRKIRDRKKYSYSDTEIDRYKGIQIYRYRDRLIPSRQIQKTDIDRYRYIQTHTAQYHRLDETGGERRTSHAYQTLLTGFVPELIEDNEPGRHQLVPLYSI